MSKTITGYFEQKGSISTVDGELVKEENINGAKSGDKVEAIKIEESESGYSYEIVKILNTTKEKVLETIEGVYSKKEGNNFGFINKPGESKGIFVHDSKSNGAEDGDIVIGKIIKIQGKEQAIIKTIIDKNTKQYVGTYHNGKIILDNKKKIRLVNNDYNLENGDVAAVILDDKKLGIVKGYLGKIGDKGVDFLKIAYEAGARVDFTTEALEEVEQLKNLCTPEEIEKREDLRGMFTITIDGDDTKDIDDAFSIEYIKETLGFKLFVHIADVSHYVKEGSAIDNEAKERGTSTYFVDHVIPMLPEKLSNDLCSLNPNTDKLTKTCEMEFDKNGKLITENIKVYNSVINSDYRTTYKEIQELKDENGIQVGDELMFGGIINDKLKELVKNSFNLSNLLAKERQSNGELNFDTSQPKIEIDDFGNPIGFKEYKMYDAMEVIKSLMVITNVSVNKKYGDGPFLHRTHEKPSDDKVESLVNIMSYFGVDMKGFKGFSNQISNLLNTLEGHPKEKFLHRIILRSMKRAVVSENREGHFGLGVDGEETGYTWFTSPIRRYADTQIHRIIGDTLSSENQELTTDQEQHYSNMMGEIALKVTIKEQKAENIAIKVNYNAALKYMKDKIGEEFTGMITGISDGGRIDIELDSTIAGEAIIDMDNINIEEIATEFYKLDNGKGDIYTPGDNVVLKLDSVNIEEENIYFEILEVKAD